MATAKKTAKKATKKTTKTAKKVELKSALLRHLRQQVKKLSLLFHLVPMTVLKSLKLRSKL